MKDRTALRKMIEDVSWKVDIIFEAQGGLSPTYYFVDGAGKTHIEPAPPSGDKDMAVALMRALFEVLDVRRFVFADEAWTVEFSPGPGHEAELQEFVKQAKQHGIRNHPNRVEVVMIMGEDEHGSLTAARKIERSPGQKARLGPLKIEEMQASEGRMVGLLPKRARGEP